MQLDADDLADVLGTAAACAFPRSRPRHHETATDREIARFRCGFQRALENLPGETTVDDLLALLEIELI